MSTLTKKLTGRARGLLHGEAASGHASATDLTRMIDHLQELFGRRLTAAIIGVTKADLVGELARGRRQPAAAEARRIRETFRVVTLLEEGESPESIRLWFTGMNPALDDRAPAVVLANDPEAVLSAARAFLAHG